MKTTILLAVLVSLTVISNAHPALLTFNAAAIGNNATQRSSWLNAIGISVPLNLVNFESGFVDNQNISGVTGLFPGGLVITDTSSAGLAKIEQGAGSIGGASPIGNFAVEQNEDPFLVLNFTATPVDYVGWIDIDHGGYTVKVTYVGGASETLTVDDAINSTEFFGIFRNDQPRITKLEFDASGGDNQWGLDNIEYGQVSAVPEPPVPLLALTGFISLMFIGRKAQIGARFQFWNFLNF